MSKSVAQRRQALVDLCGDLCLPKVWLNPSGEWAYIIRCASCRRTGNFKPGWEPHWSTQGGTKAGNSYVDAISRWSDHLDEKHGGSPVALLERLQAMLS